MTHPARAVFPWLTVVAILVAALSLRAPIVAPTPVLGEIEQDLGISPAIAGLITTAPVLAFALLTPLAAIVIRRAGAEAAVLLTLSGVLLGSVIRVIPGLGGMLTGMIVIGASITIGNIVMPVIIRRDVPTRSVPLVTAAYVAFLNAGSMLTALLTAPLAELMGWPLALLAWSLITVLGLVLWSVHMRRDRGGDAWSEHDSGEDRGGVAGDAASAVRTQSVSLTGPLPVVERARHGEKRAWQLPVAWLLTAGFAVQSGMYYALTTWLPAIAADELGTGVAASGAIASVFQGVAIVGAFLVPAIARLAPSWVAPVVISVCWLGMGLGLFFAPQAFIWWVALGAVAHAGGFVVIFTLMVRVASSDRQAAGMSALVQGVGYGVAAAAPPLIGALHEASGGWTAPLAAVLVASAAYGVFVLGAHAVARGRRA